MASFYKYEGLKYENGDAEPITDPVTVEKALQININGENFTVVMQTPGHEIELTTGLLYSEDIIGLKSKFEITILKDEHDEIEIVNVLISKQEIGQGYLSSRSLLSVSSCGICGKLSLEDIKTDGAPLSGSNFKIDSDFIFKLQSVMQNAQQIFPYTGSTHGAALFTSKGELLVCREDIGRHNALDKAVGHLINSQSLKSATFLFFSGRISYEIVSKAFRAKLKLIIAISAPSSLAIDYAKEFGIDIIGFCRDTKFTCYTNPNFLKI